MLVFFGGGCAVAALCGRATSRARVGVHGWACDPNAFQKGLTRESKMEIASRAAKFLEWLRARPETHVAVAAHSGWLLSVFNGAIAEADAEVRHWFSTGEMRTVELTFKDK